MLNARNILKNPSKQQGVLSIFHGLVPRPSVSQDFRQNVVRGQDAVIVLVLL